MPKEESFGKIIVGKIISKSQGALGIEHLFFLF